MQRIANVPGIERNSPPAVNGEHGPGWLLSQPQLPLPQRHGFCPCLAPRRHPAPLQRRWSSSSPGRSSRSVLARLRCSAGILAHGVAALLFVATEGLLVEAHETVVIPILAAASSSASSR